MNIDNNFNIPLTEIKNGKWLDPLYENVKSEKRIFKWKSKYIYYLPLNTVKHLKVGEKLILTKFNLAIIPFDNLEKNLEG